MVSMDWVKMVFLGRVVLDENLTWKSHICNVASKISKSIVIIFRSNFFLLKSSFCILYNSMILPYLNYCNLVWGSSYKTNFQRIAILPKLVIRIVNKSKIIMILFSRTLTCSDFTGTARSVHFRIQKLLKLHYLYLWHLFLIFFKKC